ncbi:MAG TPA: hypothetical protein VMG98_12745 [Verrucomicrobiae bacterium]|nr:hypothetical protein [Verrucomicrobiae bacterium]HTZ56195.1 hypothetical protein [Candidatus Acidoferrum sp.]
MAKLYQRRYLKCPYNRARELLAAEVEEAAGSGAQRRLTLVIPAVGAEIGKDVTVSVGAAVDPRHFDEPWRLHWEPVSGPYPTFDGTLTIRADEDYTTSILELQGDYQPPLGAVGAAFNAVLGSRIAHETAREFLRKLGQSLESQYRAAEEAKR